MMKAISQPAGAHANLLVFFMEIVLTYWNFAPFACSFDAYASAHSLWATACLITPKNRSRQTNL